MKPRTRGRHPTTRARRVLLAVVAGVGLIVLLGALGSALWAFTILPGELPSVTRLEEIGPSQGARIYSDDDELLTELQEVRRTFVPLSQIPLSLKQAIIAVEDAQFYSHSGINFRGIARAAWNNLRYGRIVEGGSSITQQLAKVLFLTPDKSFSRKLKEAVIAVQLERRYPKDRILELYLNQIYFGHGSYGVEAASRTYFGKSVGELGLPEAALLAALPRAPGVYSPFDRPEIATKRRDFVLNRMTEMGFITKAQARRATSTALGLVPPERRRTTGQYFVEYVHQMLEGKFGNDMVYKGGLHVYTAINPAMQLAAEQALREGLRELRERTGPKVAAKGVKGKPTSTDVRPEGALITVEPQTGYIKALVGGSDFSRSEFNRAVNARRQPGSAFKPFVYLAALEAGLTPANVIDDSPVSYVGRDGKAWKPENYNNKYRGLTTLQRGIEESINVVTVKLLERVGISQVIQVARRLGITAPLNQDLTLALGSSEVSLLELTSAYAVLANLGMRMEPIAIRYITDAQGRLLEENIPQGREVARPEAAFVASHMLRGVVERGTGVQARALGRPMAAKTGTTNDFSNAWFIGFTPNLVTGVWVGYDKPTTLGRDETGARAALPLWAAYMRRALALVPAQDFLTPERVSMAVVDLDRGCREQAGSERAVIMAFIEGSEPRTPCGGAGSGGEASSPTVLPEFVR